MMCRSKCAPPFWQLICQGNSITAGDGITPFPNLLPALVSPAITTVWKYGTDGASTPVLIAGTATIAKSPITPQGICTQMGHVIAILWEVTNDLHSNNPGAAALWENVAAWAKLYRDRGTKVIIPNCLPAGYFTTAMEADRVAYNAQLKANWQTICDATVDIASLLPDCNSPTMYQSDHIHPTQLAHTMVIAPAFSLNVLALAT
jgi:hypothetical protein